MGFIVEVVWLNVILGGESCLAFRDFSSLRTQFRAAYRMRPISFLTDMSPLELRQHIVARGGVRSLIAPN